MGNLHARLVVGRIQEMFTLHILSFTVVGFGIYLRLPSAKL
jgi:hypothetical protein